jgi:hypothetical protein
MSDHAMRRLRTNVVSLADQQPMLEVVDICLQGSTTATKFSGVSVEVYHGSANSAIDEATSYNLAQ